MDIKDLKAHFRAQEEEIESLPWFIRIPVKVGEFFRYRVWGWLEDFPAELKWDFQRFTQGHADPDVWNLGFYIIDKLYAPLKEFVKHEAEHGISLPKEFETDPAAWLEILQEIEFSVDHAWKEEHELDYFPTKKMGIEEKDEFYKKVDKGFALLGKHLRDLWN